MIFNECIISKYGKTCIPSYRLPINNLIVYISLRFTENIIKKCINSISFNCEYLDLDYLSFT
jgi:hypothetical protein